MPEPFSKPTKEQIEKARELYGDPLLYWATNVAVKALDRMMKPIHKFDFKESHLKEWEFLTRRLLWEFGLFQIVERVHELSVVNADEYWKNWTPPILVEEDELKRNIKINKETQRLKDVVKISDVAWAYEIKVKGKKAICPFHDDKNPSLSLDDKKGLFHCFGCGESGDIITFIQKLDNLKWKSQQQENKQEKN